MNRQIARETKLLWPNMAQVTAVRLPSGLNVNSAVLVPAIGCTKSSLILMNSAGRLCVSVMPPSPIWLLPAQAETAPSPADRPAAGAHAEARGEQCLAGRTAHPSAVGERREHAVGLGFVLGVDREREALEFRLALRAAVGRHHRLAVDAKA